MGQGGGHLGILDGSGKLASTSAIMQNTFKEKSGKLMRKLLIYVFNEHLHLAWQSGKEHGLGSQTEWVQILSIPLTNCVPLGNLGILSVPSAGRPNSIHVK